MQRVTGARALGAALRQTTARPGLAALRPTALRQVQQQQLLQQQRCMSTFGNLTDGFRRTVGTGLSNMIGVGEEKQTEEQTATLQFLANTEEFTPERLRDHYEHRLEHVGYVAKRAGTFKEYANTISLIDAMSPRERQGALQLSDERVEQLANVTSLDMATVKGTLQGMESFRMAHKWLRVRMTDEEPKIPTTFQEMELEMALDRRTLSAKVPKWRLRHFMRAQGWKPLRK